MLNHEQFSPVLVPDVECVIWPLTADAFQASFPAASIHGVRFGSLNVAVCLVVC